jgi:hypothetical protein
MIEIRFDKTKDEVALLIWFLVDHSVYAASLREGIQFFKFILLIFGKNLRQVNFYLNLRLEFNLVVYSFCNKT